jgi:hypothetical protein
MRPNRVADPFNPASQYPQWTGRRDRRGIPLYVFEVRKLDSKAVSEYERLGANKTFSQAKTDGKTPSGLLRLFALYENLTRFNMPFCTQLQDREFPDVPITMSTNIVDISGVGLKQFWNLKNHMQAASQLATAHYPETLDRIFIIGAPPFFSTVWGWIKRWFDPITVSKIFILGPHEVKPTLESFIDVRNIPKKYGGQLDYAFGDAAVTDPSWDGVVAWEPGYSSFPKGPLLWEDAEDGTSIVCVELGSKDGKPLKNKVCTMPKAWTPPPTVEETPAANGATVEEKATEAAAAAGSVNPEALTPAGTHEHKHHFPHLHLHRSHERKSHEQKREEGVTNGQDLEKLKLAGNETEKETAVQAVGTQPAVSAAN